MQAPGTSKTTVTARILATCLAFALAFMGLVASPAAAATKADVSGKGKESTKSFTLDKGLYQIDFSWSGNAASYTPKGYIHGNVKSADGSYTVSRYFLSGVYDDADSVRRIINVPKKNKLNLTVNAASDKTKWSAKVRKISVPKSSKTSFKVSETGPSDSKLVRLKKGTYEIKTTYSKNTGSSGNKTNFIQWIENVDKDQWFDVNGGSRLDRTLLINDIETKKTRTATLKVTASSSVFWFNVDSSAEGKWTTEITKKGTKTLKSTPTPKISGTAKVGKKLTAKAGTWKPSGVKLSYQWYRGSSKIKGATKSTYKLTKSDKGKTIKVKVKGKKSGYKSATKTSKATSKVK